MKEFTAIIHRGEPAEGGFWATCLEVSGANGQGETKEECLRNLRAAIELLLANAREEVRFAREEGKYEYTIVNDDLERAKREMVETVRAIIGSPRHE